MRNRVLTATLLTFVGLVAGAFVYAGAQTQVGVANPTTTRVKTSKEVTPSWTYKGQWKGFVTCNRLMKDGNTATAADVKKCFDAGGSCVLYGGGRLDLQPMDKCKEYAGQTVLLTGTMTSQRYGTGPTSDVAVDGLYSGGDRPATKFQGLTIVSAKVLGNEPAQRGVDSSRISDAAQK